MGHKLILEVPEEVYEPLTQMAKKTGKTPERLAVEWLTAASYVATRDPIEEFIGAFPNDVPDWVDEHDKYLGQSLLEEERGEGTGRG
jgi:hypothetical protein